MEKSKTKGASKTMNFNFSALSAVKDLVLIRGNSWIKYNFLCKTNPNFAVFGPKTTIFPKNEPKTNVYPLLTVYYENLRLFERNENKPKTNPSLGNL